MKNLADVIFPDLVTKRWDEVDLDDHVTWTITGDFPNPLLDPAFCDNWIKDFHKSLEIDHSYGGYMEDRSQLWRGHYHTNGFVHLGIDFNVPANTVTLNPFDGIVVHAIHDKDQKGGWGGRVTFYNSDGDFYYIIGHLNELAGSLTTGTRINKGCLLGWIGNSSVNGGWYPHLHLQCISSNEYKKFVSDPMAIDGYGSYELGLRNRYPNPYIKFGKQL